MVQVVEHLPSTHKALSSNIGTAKKAKQKMPNKYNAETNTPKPSW
jgi:hypothetical protein